MTDPDDRPRSACPCHDDGRWCDPDLPNEPNPFHDEDAEHDPPCCPTPQAAARNLCACWGMGAGQWIGSGPS